MSFSNIIGQEIVKKRLIQSVKDARVSHAQLFLGPEGAGKLSMAIAYAQYINCENRLPEDACGVCRSCRQFAKLTHPDLHFVYPVATTKEVPEKPSSKLFINAWREYLLNNQYYVTLPGWYEKIGIEKKQGIINAEDCNNIIKTLNYKSYESEYKVMIIWMVEKLFHSAAPKILKILEEPPEKTLFILISENQDQIINTILSRTQLVKIPKIDDQTLYNTLKLKYGLKGSSLKKMVYLSNGNYCQALDLMEESEVENEHFNLFSNWMRACWKNDISAYLSFISEISKSGREQQKSFLKFSLRVIRNCLLIHTQNPSLIKLDGEEMEFTNKFSPFINKSNVLRFTEEYNKAIFHIERNANPAVLFMDLSLINHHLLKQ